MLRDPESLKKAEENFKKVQGRLRLFYAEQSGESISLTGLGQEHTDLLRDAWGDELTIEKDKCSFHIFGDHL